MINSWLNLEQLKKEYPEAILVGEFPLKKDATQSGVVFWQPNPPHGYSNYFMMFYCCLREAVYITSGESQSQQVYNGVLTPNGDFIYSRHRHDCVTHDGCMIDGGDGHYLRRGGKGKDIKFKMKEGELIRC